MKRMNFLPMGAAALLLAFTACTDEMTEVQSGELRQIVMTASDFETEDGSRTNFQITSSGAEFSWAANDTVGIFPNEGAQAYFPMTSGAGTKSANFTGGGWALKDASTYAAYYPFIGDFYLNKNAIPVDYTGQVQTGDASTAHLGAYDYMAAAPSTPKNGNVSFAFKHLGALVQLELTFPQAITLESVILTAESEAFAIKGKVDIMSGTLGIQSVTSSKDMTLEVKNVSTTKANQKVTLYMMLPPVDLTGKTLKAVVKTNISTEEVTLDSKDFQAGKAYALSGTLKNGNGTYKNGIVRIATAGTMKKLLGDDYLNITSLKVVGPINGDDVAYLRKMLGGSDYSKADWGKLTTLDLSDATIVEGGNWYYDISDRYGNEKYTSNNVIGDYMFFECTNLQRIQLPEKITSIGDYAFCFCSSLTFIYIPDGVKSIGTAAFEKCISLPGLNFPDNLTTIWSFAFSGCSSLQIANLPDCVTDIGAYAFNNCSSILIANVPKGITSISHSMFYGCSSLQSIIIPDNVTSIGNSAFEGCSSLNSITIGKNVTSIGSYAFNDSPFDKVYCYATTPPELNYYTPFILWQKAPLYVPVGCSEKYKSSKWKNYFTNIKEMN